MLVLQVLQNSKTRVPQAHVIHVQHAHLCLWNGRPAHSSHFSTTPGSAPPNVPAFLAIDHMNSAAGFDVGEHAPTKIAARGYGPHGPRGRACTIPRLISPQPSSHCIFAASWAAAPPAAGHWMQRPLDAAGQALSHTHGGRTAVAAAHSRRPLHASHITAQP